MGGREKVQGTKVQGTKVQGMEAQGWPREALPSLGLLWGAPPCWTDRAAGVRGMCGGSGAGDTGPTLRGRWRCPAWTRWHWHWNWGAERGKGLRVWSCRGVHFGQRTTPGDWMLPGALGEGPPGHPGRGRKGAGDMAGVLLMACRLVQCHMAVQCRGAVDLSALRASASTKAKAKTSPGRGRGRGRGLQHQSELQPSWQGILLGGSGAREQERRARVGRRAGEGRPMGDTWVGA